VKNRDLVESLLSTAQPKVKDGCEVRATGCGEATVRHAGLKRYALISVDGVTVVSLLDGTRTLNEVAGEVMRRRGRVRHQALLDTVVRLHAAQLLEPLTQELDKYLKRQARHGRPGRLTRVVRRLGNLGTYLPFGWRSRSRDEATEPTPKRGLAVTVLTLALLSLALPAVGLLQRAGAGQIFGTDVIAGMVLAALGLCAAASFRALVRAGLLTALGRDVLGWGVRLSVGIPHLAVDSRDERMLNSEERVRYRSITILLLALFGAVASAVGLWGGNEELWAWGLGWQALLFAQLAPLWPGDGTRLLEELMGHRHLGRVSRVYVARKLWRHIWKLEAPHGEDLGLLVFASARLAYVFVAVAALALVLPGTLDGLTAAALEPGRLLWERALAGGIFTYLAITMLLVLLALVGAVLGGLRQIFGGRREADKPRSIAQTDTLDMADLSMELGAIPPFSDMPEKLLAQALREGRLEHYAPGSIVLRQGDPGEVCYVVRGGECEVIVEDPAGRVIEGAVLGPGHLFGEVALLENIPRTATVKARNPVDLVALDGPVFLAMVEGSDVPRERITEVLRIHLFLQQVELLRGISAAGMRTLLRALRMHRPSTGDVLVKQGDEGYSMFIIYEGQFEVQLGDQSVARLGPGEYFGEISLVTGAVRTASVVCRTEGIVVEVPAETYQRVIVGEFATGVLLDREVNARLEELDLNY